MKQKHKTTINPHQLAEKCKQQIKEAITSTAPVVTDDLHLLTDREDGVYISKEDPNTLCCLVIEKKDKFLYLVTADITEEKTALENFLAKKIA